MFTCLGALGLVERLMRNNLPKQRKLLGWSLALASAFSYLYAMCAYPFIRGGWSWGHLQRVWMAWQSLNVGVMALASSLIALKVVTYREDKQRERNFVAARAFLPHALSELCSYTNDCAEFLVRALRIIEVEGWQPTNLEIPGQPSEYRQVFANCIASAEKDVAEHLAKITYKLQVHQSRLQGVADDIAAGHRVSSLRVNLLTYLMCLGEIRAMINGAFEFSRGLGQLESGRLRWSNYKNAYFNLGHLIDKVPDLEAHTRRSLPD